MGDRNIWDGNKRADVRTKEERSALEKVKSSLTHNGSRYSLDSQDNPGLPNNRELAKNRLESTKKGTYESCHRKKDRRRLHGIYLIFLSLSWTSQQQKYVSYSTVRRSIKAWR